MTTNLKIGTGRFVLTESVSVDWTITCEKDTKKEDILDPAYWSIIAPRLTQYDTIRINFDDDSVYARLLVLNADRNYAQVRVLEWHDLHEEKMAKTDRFEEFAVMNKGPHRKYCIVRKSDGEVVYEDQMLKKVAEDWLKNNIDRIAA